MKRIISIIAQLVFCSFLVTAQQQFATISGTVHDVDGSDLPGVNLLLIGTTIGTISANDGTFMIQNVPAGTYQLRASIIGYSTQVITIGSIKSGETRRLALLLIEESVEIEPVTVTAERQRQTQNDPQSSFHSLQPRLAKQLPGFGEDVLRSLQSLPGIVAPNDFSAQLVVRGSGPDQNLIVIDDIEVFNPYRLYGFISMFNPETISDIDLITGGFPARFGDRLSAVLNVRNREGRRDAPLHTSINASITNANIVIDGHSPFGINGSYLVSARRTYYDLIAGPIAKKAGLFSNDVALPNFSDLQAKFSFYPFSGHKFVFTGLTSRDGFDVVSGTDRNSPDSVSAFNETNHRVLGVAWHYSPNPHLVMKTIGSYYRNDGYTDFGGAFLDPSLDREQFQGKERDTIGVRLFSVATTSQFLFQKYSLRHEAIWKLHTHTLEAGFGADFLATTLRFKLAVDENLRAFIAGRGATFLDAFENKKRYNRVYAFIQDRIQLGPFLFLQPGLRFDHYQILQKSYLSPRLNLVYALNEITSLRFAYGIFRQSPGYEKVVDQTENKFTDLNTVAPGSLEAERAHHLVLGIDRWVTGEIQVKADLYYKKFDDLIIPAILRGTRWGTTLLQGRNPWAVQSWTTPIRTAVDSQTTTPVNGSYGEAYGVEFFLERKQFSREEKLYGWISYSLAWAQRFQRGRVIPFNFDQRHTITAVGNYQINDWLDLGLSWKFGSNFPYTPALGVKPRIIGLVKNGIETPLLQTDYRGNVIFDIDRGGPENLNSGRKPSYHRLDLRLTAYTQFWNADWSFYLDVINAYNHTNVLSYGYYIKEDLSLGVRQTGMFPILPTLGFSVKF